MPGETQTPQNNAELSEAWNTPTPYGEIRTGSAFELGQYDWNCQQLTPGTSDKGLYTITIEAKALAPSEIANLPGRMGVFTRTLYVGTNKDKMAKLPETRQNSSALRFLKKIAEVNKLPSGGNMTDAQMCQQILGKNFGCALVQGKEYTDKDGNKREGGLEFGRTVTPIGTLPAKLNRVAATATSHGPNGAAQPTTGSVFA